ncbi:PstS family phosphate ABC transporter substrate-binding protein [Streptomyces sp. ISL-111]|uniref:PstS family phosphate ABC transporter substrate-binding protein n=1 Tax=unclassified Streptomyces TaxID=2593676 RepID=UPI001BE77E72|nr:MULTISPECIES: PstS family phosphate ABC transporter substrate-binding protein [unclassified Streptomyces]MBT2377045.1 PstS family phosphate ABC transporter substrate-binding protein [Streptomyces sp. ISL-111]MBT2425562.1 PstS family phosphate ABC transporter substrate-binding protein [Streptomyces sp. ISL-112]MBT2463691.1 PstS family phosphate ABC transporter substrate-binding protein [Streptomyces sp. ISL-63]
MNISTSLRRAKAPLALTAAVMLAASACGGGDAGSGGEGGDKLSGTVKVDGSSTVAPLSTVAAQLFQQANKGVNVTVGTSGTGGGFEKFCADETDISNASREMKDEEKALCEKKGVKFEEFTVANDGLSVVVSKDNDFVECLTVEQLKKIWEPGSKVNNWNQVDPKFPNQKMDLFGAGTDSGTFDYFTDAINGEEGASRTDYNPSEDDNVTVRGVSGSKGGIGYFGLSYFEENKDKLKALKIDGGEGCVAPSVETVQNGTYKPLGRPLFIYPKASSLEKPEAEAFVEYYVENSAEIAEKAQFVPLNDEQQKELEKDLATLREQHS